MKLKEMRSEVMRKIKFGQVLRIHSGDSRNDTVTEVRVTAFYPNVVVCHGAGYQLCYTYYELWKLLQPRKTKMIVPDYIKG